MTFKIRFGFPEAYRVWFSLCELVSSRKANPKEERLYRRLKKAILLLADNPRHPGLHSHEIDVLTKRYGISVWESYLENNTPAAGRIFWAFGPDRGEITILSIMPHPNDKSNAYGKIRLSMLSKPLNDDE